MGDIPAKTNMVSSVITFPTTGGKAIASDTTFNISVQMSNLVAGAFTNADATYYGGPQFLSGGNIVGHTHVTVQDMGKSLNPTAALDPTQFAFFKGINDAGNGKGLLQAVVTGGLPAGNYRVCTLAAAQNHQPVLMPVAQRGTADDCTKFTVSGNGNTANAAANDGSVGLAASSAAAAAVKAGPGAVDTALVDAATASSSSSAAAGKGGKAGKGAGTTAAAAAVNTGAADASATAAKGGKGKAAGSTAAVAAASTGNAKAGAGAKGGAAAKAKGGKGRKQRRSRLFVA